MSCKQCKKNKKHYLSEQYPEQGTGGGNAGGTNTSSSGQYISGGAWDQQGPFFNSRRETPRTEVREVDITNGNGGQQYAGYTQGLSIDQIPTDNQSPGNNIESTEDIGPQYSISNTQDNGYRDPYDDDNPDPYDRQKPKPKSKPEEKEWRSPPCCKPCKSGKFRWKHDCGELERAAGSKPSKSTGCIYVTISDCQLNKKSINEQTSADNSGQYESPAAWEAGGILTIPTSNEMVGSETLSTAPEVGMMDQLDDMELTILTIDDVDNGMMGGLESLLGDVVSDDDVEYDGEEVDIDIITTEENNELYEKYSYKTSSTQKPITESVSKIRKMIKRMS